MGISDKHVRKISTLVPEPFRQLLAEGSAIRSAAFRSTPDLLWLPGLYTMLYALETLSCV